MPLDLQDTIPISTRLGTSHIQLYLGDICDLPQEDKVDIIFTSAFPGDYSPVPRTLIHALKQKQDISVYQLAQQKEFDLRKHFSCWVSARLPEDKPYRRLVCFEIDHAKGNSITQQMSMVFRAMMPIFNGNESTIITPILATGCQGAPMEVMLRVMISTAIYWIKAGLPLKCLKLVLFSLTPDRDAKFMYKDTISEFISLKNKHLSKSYECEYKGEIEKQNYNICFCYSKSDNVWMEKISKKILAMNTKMKIYLDLFEPSENSSWQEDVFKILSRSMRILIVLTPSFVADPFCLEQFSMALCCNRLRSQNVVIPFYVETVQAFPSYMTLIQYTECRVRKDGESETEKITSACTDLVSAIEMSQMESDSKDNTLDSPWVTTTVVKEPAPIYDILVSYSHNNPEVARKLVDLLAEKHPKLNVFFDREELKTGNIWQQTLYDAVDKTRCFVAMLADAYLKSSVCQEEWNIATARALANDNMVMTSVCLPQLSSIPSTYTQGSKVKLLNDTDQLEELCDRLAGAVGGMNRGQELNVNAVKDVLSQKRKKVFNEKYIFDLDTKTIIPKTSDIAKKQEITGTVTFSYVTDGLRFAAILSEFLKKDAPNLTTTLLSGSAAEARMEIDKSDIVVMVVTDEYLNSDLHLEELHMALCRQRTVKDSTVVYLLQGDHVCTQPFYPHTLPFGVSLGDKHWEELQRKCGGMNKMSVIVNSQGMSGTYMASTAHHLALQQAKEDILSQLLSRGNGSNLSTNLCSVGKISADLNAETEMEIEVDKVAVKLSELILDSCKSNAKHSMSNKVSNETKSQSLHGKGKNECVEKKTKEEKAEDRKLVKEKLNQMDDKTNEEMETTQNNTSANLEQTEINTNDEEKTVTNDSSDKQAEENTAHIQKAREDIELQKQLLKELEEYENEKSVPKKTSSSCEII